MISIRFVAALALAVPLTACAGSAVQHSPGSSGSGPAPFHFADVSVGPIGVGGPADASAHEPGSGRDLPANDHVSSRVAWANTEAPHHRFELALSAASGSPMRNRLQAHLSAHGHSPSSRHGSYHEQRHSSAPVAVSIRADLVGPWVLEFGAAREGFEVRGIQYATDALLHSGGAVSNRMDSREFSILAGRRYRSVLAGIGVAHHVVESTWTSGYCACGNRTDQEESATGPAAHVVFTLPQRTPLMVEARASGRYFPTRTIEEYRGISVFEYGGLDLRASLGIGFRF